MALRAVQRPPRVSQRGSQVLRLAIKASLLRPFCLSDLSQPCRSLSHSCAAACCSFSRLLPWLCPLPRMLLPKILLGPPSPSSPLREHHLLSEAVGLLHFNTAPPGTLPASCSPMPPCFPPFVQNPYLLSSHWTHFLVYYMYVLVSDRGLCPVTHAGAQA